MSDRFANREVCDLIISDYKSQKPLLYCDYANTNSTELTSESVHAFGGWGHPRRIGFNGEKGGTLTVETQLQSFQLWSLLTGGTATRVENQIDFDNITVTCPEGTTASVTIDKKNRGLTVARESGSGYVTVTFNGMEAKKGAVYICGMHLKYAQGVMPVIEFGLSGHMIRMPQNTEGLNKYVHSDAIIADFDDALSFYVRTSSTSPVEITNLYVGEVSYVITRRVCEAMNNGWIYLDPNKGIISDTVTIFAANDDCGTPLTRYTISGDVIRGDDIVANQSYIVYAATYMPRGSQRLNISTTTFPRAVSISALTYNKTADDDILPYQMLIRKAQPQANLTLTNSNTGDPVTLTMTFDLMADKGNNMLDMILMENLEIIEQPMNYVGPPGNIVVFTVVATGVGLSYQWQYSSDNGVTWQNSTYGSANTSELRMTALERFDGYLYRCVITDVNDNTVTTNAAKVDLHIERSGTFSPSSFSVYAGSTTDTFTLTYSGGGDPSFKTKINGLLPSERVSLAVIDKSVTEGVDTTTVTFKIKCNVSGGFRAQLYTASVTVSVPDTGVYDAFEKTMTGTADLRA